MHDEHEKDKESVDVDFEVTDEEGVEELTGSKLKKLRDELKKAQVEKAEYLAGWQRAKADYINLQNTEEKNRGDIVKFAKEGLLVDLIPLADSFDMAMSNKAIWEEAPENWRRGIEYIYQELQNIFRDNKLEIVLPQKGDSLDPRLHESIGVVETEREDEDGKILEVVKKGYILQGKLIRPAQVKTGELKIK